MKTEWERCQMRKNESLFRKPLRKEGRIRDEGKE
jgi:hypothetical protein